MSMSPPRWARQWPWVLLCVLCTRAAPAHAQAPTDATVANEVAHESASAALPFAAPSSELPSVESELTLLRSALEQAEFEAAQTQAQALLRRISLSARQRNDTLELLAVAQIAARKETLAAATLAELYARDPEHVARLRDPGPDVETFFARVRAQNQPSLTAALEVTAQRNARAQVQVAITLGAGHDAVDTVHVFTPGSPSTVEAGEPAQEPTHLVADVGSRSRLLFGLPAVSLRASVVELHIEARAPSGFVLGQSGPLDSPLRERLEPDLANSAQIQPPPLGRTWWLWTSVAIVAAGMGVTGALLAH